MGGLSSTARTEAIDPAKRVEMPISALAPWFGSKRTLAPRIVEALGPHRCYWEPFAGGMAVLFAKSVCTAETVNDLHGDLVNLARVVRDVKCGPELYRRVRLTLCGDEEFTDAKAAVHARTLPDDAEHEAPDVGRAESYLKWVWMGRNGAAGLEPSNKGGFCVRWSGNGGSPGVRWAGVVRSIAAWRRRLARVTVLRRDAFEVIGEIKDEKGTAIYCDPPYLGKSDRYTHDFETHDGGGLMGDDHTRLARALHRFRKARVVVSYYAHPRLAHLYPTEEGWTHTEITVNRNMSNSSGTAAKAVEVLIGRGGTACG